MAIRQLGERVEHRPLARETTRLLYQTRELKADLPKLVIDDLVGFADEAPTGPESLMGASRELDVGTIRCFSDGRRERTSCPWYARAIGFQAARVVASVTPGTLGLVFLRAVMASLRRRPSS